MSLNAILFNASNHLDATAKSAGIGSEQFEAMTALRDAADFLFDAAEAVARGEPHKTDTMGPTLALSLHAAEGKLSEAAEKYGVKALTRDQWKVRRSAVKGV